MNKLKSLSDSSTSESEDDHGKRIHQNKPSQFEIWNNKKRTLSTDDNEDINHDFDSSINRLKGDFKSPTKYTERYSSTSESEDDYGKRFHQNKSANIELWGNRNSTLSTDDNEDVTHEIQFPSKKFKSDFKSPTKYTERSLSESEGEEKSNSKEEESDGMPDVDLYGPGSKLMEKMGYKKGTGLGKYAQGRVEIVEASKQRGRRGLGMIVQGFEPSDTQWDSSLEQISVQEEVSWIPECQNESLKLSQLRNWMKEGKKKLTIDDEHEFCEPKILQDVLNYKTVFDALDANDMRKARARSNPFETIGGGIFLNRAAMKMANMDCIFDFMFTNPKDKNGHPLVSNKELLYFADVCAGPGGFSEYVLWRKKWEAKGFGFTLKGQNDFKLDDFFAGPPETFEPHYGCDNDGNIYSSGNLREFRRYVLENTDGKGVHFVMADGGFSVEGQENLQEILSKRLYLCQFLCALLILRTNGHFVCKLFDIYTTFSIGLIYLLYHAFEKVCIFKPNTSRPANSERYIICKCRKENSKDICDYFYEINCQMEKTCGTLSELDIVEVVPLHILKENTVFYDYIVNSNNSLGARQIIHLDKIRVFEKNSNLHEVRQSELRKKCLTLWKVPDQARAAPPRPDPATKFRELMKKGTAQDSFDHNVKAELLTKETLKKLESVLDYHCVVCGESKIGYEEEQPPSLFLGVGRKNVYRFDVKNSKWIKVEKVEIPADTIFYGELIPELKGESRAQKKIFSIHIIDALFLGGTDMRKQHFESRMLFAAKLVKAVSKSNKSEFMPLRVKEVFPLRKLNNLLSKLSMKRLKSPSRLRLCFDLQDGQHIIPSGVLIFKTTADQWVTAFSKKNQQNYFFNTKRNISLFQIVPEAIASFNNCFSKRIFWNWDANVKLIDEQQGNFKESEIHGEKLLTFVMECLVKITGQV